MILIRIGFDIQFEIPAPVAMIALYHVHPSRRADLREPDEPRITPEVRTNEYQDSYGNLCTRFVAPAGKLQLYHSTLIADSGEPDAVNPQARQLPVEDLPPEVLRYLLPSRYCEVDRLLDIAGNLFGNSQPGWARVQAVCDWVQANITFGYPFANPVADRAECFRGSQRRVPRFSASRDYVLPLFEYSGPLRHRIPGGHRRSVTCRRWISARGLRLTWRGAGGRLTRATIRRESDAC